MYWFLIALTSPALWAICNHIDKYLLGKYFKGGGAGALIIFSSVIAVFVLPFILLIHPNVIEIEVWQAAIQMVAGMLYILAILIYLYALKNDEASIVVPLFQTVPIFGFILGYFILGETLTTSQVIGALLIIGGGISLSLDLSNKIPKLKTLLLVQMLAASFLIATNALIFKTVALETDFWTTAFWGYMGDVSVAVFLFVFIKKYRREFIQTIRTNNVPVLGLNILNEILNVAAVWAQRFASLLAPLAIVLAVNGFQPLFVFAYGLILTLFLPHLGKESLLKKHLAQKIIAILVMFMGTYVLYF